ncbi:MAG: hypothetical protein LBT20_01465 [Clostridiales bacterium]|jgi:predicted Fe-Mo cluster-binding NifX family protein|nr:hypothetical protein [Clostridiales bacterium]
MNYRVAVGSSDGKALDVHFGKCAKYFVYESDFSEGAFLFKEVREIEPVCKQCGRSEHDFGEVAETLSDCKIILVSRIGYPSRAYMESRGFAVLSDDGLVGDALARLISHLYDFHSERKNGEL